MMMILKYCSLIKISTIDNTKCLIDFLQKMYVEIMIEINDDIDQINMYKLNFRIIRLERKLKEHSKPYS